VQFWRSIVVVSAEKNSAELLLLHFWHEIKNSVSCFLVVPLPPT
jgi:hypothetical protein